mgnify:CR=1 FL=1|jgi:hypothetical protein
MGCLYIQEGEKGTSPRLVNSSALRPFSQLAADRLVDALGDPLDIVLVQTRH